MGGAVESVGDFIQDEVIDPIKDVGRDVDKFVRDEVPGGWLTVGAATGAGLLGSGALGGAAAEGAAATGAFDAGLGLDAMTGGAGLVGGGAAAAPIVDATYAAGMTPTPGLTATVPTTGSLGATTSLGATSSAVPGSLQAFLPELGVSTAASTAGATAIPGSFQAALPGILSPAAASFGLKDAVDALRVGNSIRGMLGQPEPQIPNMLGRNQMPQGSVDYSAYLNLLAQRPRRADITTLLG